MSQSALFDDTLDGFVLPATAPPSRRVRVAGWVKTYQKTGQSPLPTLIHVPGDGNAYREACFELSPGAGLGEYPVSKCRGVCHGGEIMPMYEAVQRGLAREVSP